MSTKISSSWVNDKVTPNVTGPSEKGPWIEIPLRWTPDHVQFQKRRVQNPLITEFQISFQRFHSVPMSSCWSRRSKICSDESRHTMYSSLVMRVRLCRTNVCLKLIDQTAFPEYGRSSSCFNTASWIFSR